MSELNGDEIVQANRQSVDFWTHDAEGQLRLAKISTLASIGFAAVSGAILARPEVTPLAVPGFIISGWFAKAALGEVKEAMKLNRIAGNRNPKIEPYES